MTHDVESACHETLSHDQAIEEVAACAKRLFATVTAQQARDLASVILRELEARGVRLVRDADGDCHPAS